MYVHVDGLSKTKCNVYKTHLRQLSCPVKKVSGVGNDKNEPLIRLADALAGASAELRNSFTTNPVNGRDLD